MTGSQEALERAEKWRIWSTGTARRRVAFPKCQHAVPMQTPLAISWPGTWHADPTSNWFLNQKEFCKVHAAWICMSLKEFVTTYVVIVVLWFSLIRFGMVSAINWLQTNELNEKLRDAQMEGLVLGPPWTQLLAGLAHARRDAPSCRVPKSPRSTVAVILGLMESTHGDKWRSAETLTRLNYRLH
jgi:hypothetical protein